MTIIYQNELSEAQLKREYFMYLSNGNEGNKKLIYALVSYSGFCYMLTENSVIVRFPKDILNYDCEPEIWILNNDVEEVSLFEFLEDFCDDELNYIITYED